MQPKTAQILNYLLYLGASLVAVSLAIYFQITDSLVPCNLCLAQRMGHYLLLIFGFLSLGAFLLNWKKTSFFLHLMSFLSTIAGLAFALKHYLLHHLGSDDASASCSATTLEQMIAKMPMSDVLTKLMTSSADCSKIDWQLYGMSMADYSLIAFLVILILQLNLLIKKI